MRKMPRQITNMWSLPTVYLPESVGWSIDTHVYPDHLCIQQVGGPEIVKGSPDGGAFIEARRYQIWGIGVYTTLIVCDSEGAPHCSTDTLIKTHPLSDMLATTIASVMLIGVGNVDQCNTLADLYDGVCLDTARAMMSAWWADEQGPLLDAPDGHVRRLATQCHWSPHSSLPVGFGHTHRDLRRPLPLKFD